MIDLCLGSITHKTVSLVNKLKMGKNSTTYHHLKSSDSKNKDNQWFQNGDQEVLDAEESGVREDQSI